METKTHNKKLHSLYSSPNTTRVIKSRMIKCAGGEPRMGENKNAYKISVGKPEGRYRSENLRIDMSIILKWILNK